MDRIGIGAGTNMNFNYRINTLIANDTTETLHVNVADCQGSEFSRDLKPREGFKAKTRNSGVFNAKVYRWSPGTNALEKTPAAECGDIAGYYAIFSNESGRSGSRILSKTGKHISEMSQEWQDFFAHQTDKTANQSDDDSDGPPSYDDSQQRPTKT